LGNPQPSSYGFGYGEGSTTVRHAGKPEDTV